MSALSQALHKLISEEPISATRARLELKLSPVQTQIAELELNNTKLEAALKRTRDALQAAHALDSADTVEFHFPDSDDSVDKSIKCSRTLVRGWSPAFDALIRHGNSLASALPEKIELKETMASLFQVALQFQSSGQLSAYAVNDDSKHHEHPLLQFADRFDLQELKKEYLAIALENVPLDVGTASWHLHLASFGLPDHTAKCIDLLSNLASNPGRRQFRTLALDTAKLVLANEQLTLVGGREHEALICFRQWVEHDPSRIKQAHELLQSVRLSLLKVEELANFLDEVDTKDLWKDVKVQINAQIQAALNYKISNESVRDKKRKMSVLDESAAEQKLIKVMRLTTVMHEPTASGAC